MPNRANQGRRSVQDIGSTWALAFSPDGTRLASGGEDGVTRLWDTSTGTMTALCRGHTRKVFSVAFRPDGLRLVTSSADGTVRQWNPATGQEVLAPYDRHTGEVLTAKYSSDGEWIASAGTDRTVRVWRAASRQDEGVLQGHIGDINDLAFAADGHRLASVSQTPRRGSEANHDGTVRLWEVGSQGAASVLRGHKSYVYPVAYSPDGQWIASGDWDNKVFLWDALTMEHIASLPHPGNIRVLAFSPDSSWLVVGCAIGRFALPLERNDRPAPEQVQGPWRHRDSGNRGEPGWSPDRGRRCRWIGVHPGSGDRRPDRFLSNGRRHQLREKVASLQPRRPAFGRYR